MPTILIFFIAVSDTGEGLALFLMGPFEAEKQNGVQISVGQTLSSIANSGKDVNECIHSINREMVNISNWIICNKLSLNVEKTNFIVFSKKKLTEDLPPISVNGSHIERVNSIKFLGVIIDDKLSWNNHINHIKNKVSKSIGMLSCARKNLNPETLLKLYFAFIHPYLSYCLDVWGQCNQQYFLSLFRLQKRAIRLITFSNKMTHSAPLFQSLGILSLESMYILSVLLFVFKFHHRILPPVVDELFQFNSSIHSVNTRQRSLLHVPIIRSKYTKQSIRSRGVHIWNQIPQMVDINLTLNQFRSSMRRRLIDGSLSIRLTSIQWRLPCSSWWIWLCALASFFLLPFSHNCSCCYFSPSIFIFFGCKSIFFFVFYFILLLCRSRFHYCPFISNNFFYYAVQGYCK